MKLGIVLSTADAETAWNAVRFGAAAVDEGHEVAVFLLGAGVEVEGIVHGEFDVQEQVRRFASKGGKFMACGTCLDLREQEASSVCPVSTMSDLVKLVESSDKVVTFG